jgi:hypothetical protein
LTLAPGSHVITMSLAGYRPLERTWNIAAGFSPQGPERLEPLPARIQFVSDLPEAKLLVDGDSKTSDLTLNAAHKLRIESGSGALEAEFTASPAANPNVRVTPAKIAASAILLSTFDTRGRIYTSAPVKVSADGGVSFRDAGPEGLDLDPLPSSGMLTIQFANGPQRTLPVAVEQAPLIQAFLIDSKSAATGGVSIDVSEAGFVVLVDGKRFPYGRKGPPYPVYNVREGSHVIQIQKEGYRAEPESITAEVKENRFTPLKFTLSASAPALILHGAVPGTRVTADSRNLGDADEKGDLQVELRPDRYTITLAKKGYHPRTFSRQVTLGMQWAIAPPESRLDPITGTIEIQKEPSTGMRLTIRQIDGVPMEGPKTFEEAPTKLTLPIGHYVLEFSAEGYKSDPVGPIGLTENQVLKLPEKLVRR